MNTRITLWKCAFICAIFTTGSILSAGATGLKNSYESNATPVVTDEEPPEITPPADIQIELGEGQCSIVIDDLGIPVTSDNVGVVNVFNDAPAEFPVGGTEVTWTAVDEAGNETTAVQGIKVVDNIHPQVEQPEVKIFSSDNDACSASDKVLAPPNATDNCTIASITNDAPSVFPLGETIVTWTVEDNEGNQTKAEQLVIVEDQVAPQIFAPQNIERSTSSEMCGAEVQELGEPSVSDNCTIESVENDAPQFFSRGENIVTWTVTDAAGNTATAQQQVMIIDTKAPVPAQEELPAIQSDCGFTIEEMPIALDNCGGEIQATTESNLTFEEQGNYEVIWNYEDAAGNRSQQVQEVIVQDMAAPEVVSMPEDIEACEGTIVAFDMPVAVDCSGVTVEQKSGPATGSVFPLGETEVVFKFTDGFENIREEGFTVTVHPRPQFEVNTSMASCNLSDGVAELDIALAAEPFELDWEGNDPQALPAGDYQVRLEDANGCYVIRDFSIENPESPSAEISTNPATCFGMPDGSAELEITGGTPEYTVDWEGHNPEALENGDYSVSVVDAANCRTTVEFTIEEPEEVLIDGTVTDAQGGMSNGAIDISVIGGVPGYSFSWDNGEQTEDLTGLAPGQYNVTVTDENDCSKTKLYVVDNTVGIEENEETNFSLYPNPTTGEVNISMTGDSKNATLKVVDLTGKVIEFIDLTEVDRSNFKFDISEYAEGIYLIKLNDGEKSTVKRIVKRNR
ncbi:HYR domain-containing protein [Halocola ammonii]